MNRKVDYSLLLLLDKDLYVPTSKSNFQFRNENYESALDAFDRDIEQLLGEGNSFKKPVCDCKIAA